MASDQETTAEGVPLPLAGIRVLDVASFIAAPVAATVMGDYGATVVKVEPPLSGDPNRSIRSLPSYPRTDVNYPWEMDSRGKRSIAIDLKTQAGQDLLHRMARSSDVLITNYPLSVRGRLRLRFEDLAPQAPRLIYASFTGYGETGPDADQVGFDSTAFFARSGLFDCNRYEGQPPGVAMPGQGDRMSGMSLLAGIMMALWQRQRTGRGLQVTSSLFANGLWSNGVGAQAALLGSFLPPRPPRERPRSALTNPYRTRDDRWMQLTIVREDKDWKPFCGVIGRPDLETDPRFDDMTKRRANSGALVSALDEVFAQQDWAYWSECFKTAGIPVGLIGQLRDLPGDAQAVACGAVVTTANPRMPRTLAAPFGLSGVAVPPARPAPDLGEHSAEVLAELGLTEAEIAGFRASGVIA